MTTSMPLLYLDPGAGSLLVQALLAGAAGVVVFLRVQGRRLLGRARSAGSEAASEATTGGARGDRGDGAHGDAQGPRRHGDGREATAGGADRADGPDGDGARDVAETGDRRGA